MLKKWSQKFYLSIIDGLISELRISALFISYQCEHNGEHNEHNGEHNEHNGEHNGEHNEHNGEHNGYFSIAILT